MIEKALKKARLSTQLSIADMAQRLGCKEASVQRYENGSKLISERVIHVYAQAAGVAASILILYSESLRYPGRVSLPDTAPQWMHK